MSNPDNLERKERPNWAAGDPMPGSGMQYMLGIGLVFFVVVASLVFYNATSDHPATATNVTATQHAGSPRSAAPAPQPQTQ
jgi:hypothetical protein